MYSSISFVGGPYDGCVRAKEDDSMLIGEIEMPVSPNVLRLLTGEAVGDETAIRSVANYRLVFTPHGPRYRFRSFRRVDRLANKELAIWHHALLSAWRKIKEQERPR